MLLRHFLHAQNHCRKIRISTSASRTFAHNGPYIGDLPNLPRPNNASTSTLATATETGSDQTPSPLARVKLADRRSRPERAFRNSNLDFRESRRSHHFYGQGLTEVLHSGNPDLIEKAIKDLLHTGEEFSVSTWLPFFRWEVLQHISLPTLTAILSSIDPRKQPGLLSMTLDRILQRLLFQGQTEDVGLALTLLHPHILRNVKSLGPARIHTASYKPPTTVRSSFLFLQGFLHIDQEKAVEIFHHLARLGHIPPIAMVDSSSSQTLEQIISLSLVKASLYWNWNAVAEVALSSLLQSPPTPEPFIIRHAMDCLYNLIFLADEKGLHRCLNAMRILHSHSPLPDSLIRQFYDRAIEVDAMDVAENLYNFSRDPSILALHRYPAPQGLALSKLMFHFATQSQKTHSVRVLASDVVKGQLLVPLNDRARFIEVVASHGIASSARALWEAYGHGKDGSLVYGDSSLMVRMTSICTKLAEQAETMKRTRRFGDSHDAELEIASDLRSFVRHVISKFKEHHEPWKIADHRAMTSYARACFIIGENAEGFNIFKVLLKRVELPDMHDVNVALGAIAKQAPGAAARMIGKMETHGVVPDLVSLGTVLHHATMHKRTDIVHEMIQRLLQIQKLYSNVGAVGAVVKAVVLPEEEDTRESRVLKLQSAWELVQRCAKSGVRMSTHIGNHLVSLAIAAQDAPLAFNFWYTLLKDGADYDDGQQRRQRNAIILLTLEQNRRGEITGTQTRTIVSELERQNT